MSIKETITKVLNQRESRLPRLEKIENGLSGLDNRVSGLQRKAKQTPPEVDIPQEFSRVTSDMDIQIRDIKKDIEYIGKSVSDLIKRFSKGTINVGVAGRTGQGKSTLLQKISELPNEIIPASTGLACTGTKSMIYHTESETRVTIDFYSEEEFLKEVIHFYFDRLGLSPKPSSLEQFEETPLAEFKNDNDREIYNEASYERLSSIRNALPSFKSLLSQGSMTLNRPEDISLYILKHDSHGRELTNHRAVKVANIHTKFPKQDVTGLCLVDLPGLEAAEGFEKKLVTSLEYEVDAVVFIKRPDPLRIDFDEVDYRVIDLINSTVKEVELANWLFIILNELDGKSNISSCEKMKEKLPQEAPRLGTSNILIANVNDSTQAEKVFSTVLTHLENKLENTDKQFVTALAKKMDLEVTH